jgi:hypothetical protein
VKSLPVGGPSPPVLPTSGDAPLRGPHVAVAIQQVADGRQRTGDHHERVLARLADYGPNCRRDAQANGHHRDADKAEAELLAPVCTLKKGCATAACTVRSNQFRFGLRLVITGDDLPRMQVVRTQEDVIRGQEEWRAALDPWVWNLCPKPASASARSVLAG